MLRWWLDQRGEGRPDDFPPGFEGGLAHRLDVSTSGVLLACHDRGTLLAAREAFTRKRLRKVYRFLSAGQAEADRFEVTLPIAHHKRRRDRMVVRRGPRTQHRGKWYPARTSFRHLRGRLWEAVIETGVMHQIRVHAASAGLPLDGDAIYGGAPLVGASPGVRFALHHARMGGWGSCPFCPIPPDSFWSVGG